VKISSLSRRTGVPIATIKFYLRENLLHPGTPTARNQAEYDETHEKRLRLIGVLTGLGMMPLLSVRSIIEAVDSDKSSAKDVAAAVNDALTAQYAQACAKVAADVDTMQAAGAQVDELVTMFGWRISPDAESRSKLARIIAELRDLGLSPDTPTLAPYAEAAQRLAAYELGLAQADTNAAVAASVVLFETAFAIIRRMAYENQLAAGGKGHQRPRRQRIHIKETSA
jgi:DNA-binding transcriptional MerR regulator